MTNIDVEQLIKGFENDPRLKEFLLSKVKAPSPRQKQKEEVKYKYTSVDVPVTHIYNCRLCGSVTEVEHIVRFTKGEIEGRTKEEVAQIAKNPIVKRLPLEVLSCSRCYDTLLAMEHTVLVDKVLAFSDSLKKKYKSPFIRPLKVEVKEKEDKDYDQERL